MARVRTKVPLLDESVTLIAESFVSIPSQEIWQCMLPGNEEEDASAGERRVEPGQARTDFEAGKDDIVGAVATDFVRLPVLMEVHASEVGAAGNEVAPEMGLGDELAQRLGHGLGELGGLRRLVGAHRVGDRVCGRLHHGGRNWAELS